VAKVGKLEFSGFIAWLAWLMLHLYYLVGHRNRFSAVVAWLISLGRGRGQMIITSQMIYARLAMTKVGARTWETLTAAEQAEDAERHEPPRRRDELAF